MAAPGLYTVAIKNEGRIQKQTFELLMDPRIIDAGLNIEDLKMQEQLSLDLRDLLTASRKMATDVKVRREELSKKAEKGKLSKKASAENKILAFIESELVTSEGRYMTPMIIDQINYLASMLDRADQLPGKDAYLRYDELKARFEALMPDYQNYFSSK